MPRILLAALGSEPGLLPPVRSAVTRAMKHHHARPPGPLAPRKCDTVPSALWATEDVPTLLDHILLGCSDLDHGIAFVEQHTGARAAFGGVHPGRGTRNALLSLGERCYFEIIAPDPKQKDVSLPPVPVEDLRKLDTPRLFVWAAQTRDLDTRARQLGEAGIAFADPSAGSRSRPDGRTLRWRFLFLADDRRGTLPFLIEWGAGSIHPSADAPGGCRLESLVVSGPDPAGLSKILGLMGVDVRVEKSEQPGLRACIVGPKGKLEMSS